jgi:uncharacterized protein YxjI
VRAHDDVNLPGLGSDTVRAATVATCDRRFSGGCGGVPTVRDNHRMRYVMRERMLSLGDDFTIKNSDGDDVFYVDGKALSFRNKLSFKDMNGRELARIEQKLLNIGPQYAIIRGDETVAVVKKKLFTLLRARFTVDVPGPNDLEAHGDFLDHEYTFERNGREVARVSKRWISLSDAYVVDVDDAEDDVVILATAVVIDLVSHPDDDS